MLSLPVLFFVLCCLFAVAFYAIGSLFWTDARRNILAFTAGTGNTGYFGIPVALTLFDERVLGVMVLSILGFVLYENSVGFFITARGHHTPRQALGKVLRLPTMYAFFLGVAVNLSGVELGEAYTAMAQNFRGAYTVLGMMIIGLGMAGMERLSFDWLFLGIAFIAKFLAWPLAVGSFIVLDQAVLHLYTADIHRVLILLSAVPLAANTVAVATELHTVPEKAALAVLLSTGIALVTIPAMSLFFL